MNVGWQFDRGQYDPEAGTTPVKLVFTIGGDSGRSSTEVIISEEAARKMRDDLDKVCGSGLAVASAMPESNGHGGAG